MKKLFGIGIAVCLAVTTLGVHALSFGPDTLFLDADTAETCEQMGGSFTEWYDETYCTTTPSAYLTKGEKTMIDGVVQRIMTLVKDDSGLYTEVMSMLEAYKVRFMEEKDTRRTAVAMLLVQGIQDTVSTIPETCTVWFDGCNTCQVMEEGELACTKMACAEMTMPYCIDGLDEEVDSTKATDYNSSRSNKNSNN